MYRSSHLLVAPAFCPKQTLEKQKVLRQGKLKEVQKYVMFHRLLQGTDQIPRLDVAACVPVSA